MSAAWKITGENKTWAVAGAFTSNLVPALSLFIIGYPLCRATIRTMLIGWFLLMVAATRLVLNRYFQKAGFALPVRAVITISSDFRRYR